jgi:tetratricopeptide (TPR) repeat protein
VSLAFQAWVISAEYTISRRNFPMMKSAISILFASSALALSGAPALAQTAAPADPAAPAEAQPAPADQSAQPAPADQSAPAGQAAPAGQSAAPQLTAEQAEAQNKAIADFTAAQQAQAAGNHAEAVAKLEPALPVIREIVSRDPNSIQNAGFLASALTITANSQGAMGNIDAIPPLYTEAAPLWMKVYESDKANTGVRGTLVSILVNLGNFNLNKQDTAAARPNFEQALAIVKEGRASDPADPELANAEFSSLIGLNQSTGEASYLEQAKPVGEELRAKNAVSAANKPAVDAILGAA